MRKRDAAQPPASKGANTSSNNSSSQSVGKRAPLTAAVSASSVAIPSGPLTRIQLAHESLGADSMPSIASLVSLNPVVSVDLTSNRIDSGGARVLFEALACECSTLTSLSLAHNQLGDEGADAAAALLQVHPHLRSLDLASNDIGLPGMQSLARALAANHTLTALNLAGNPLSDGLISLSLALQPHSASALRSLCISDCQLDDAVAHHLLLLLAHNTSILQLDLRDNPHVSRELHAKLEATIARRNRARIVALRELHSESTSVREKHIAERKAQILSLPLADYCMELQKHMIEYYDDLQLQLRIAMHEIDPQNYTLPRVVEQSADEEAGATEGAGGFLMPVRRRKGSHARREEKAAAAAAAAAAVATESQAGKKKQGLGARIRASFASKPKPDVKSTTKSAPTASASASDVEETHAESGRSESRPDQPSHLQLHLLLQLFPAVVQRLTDSLERFTNKARQSHFASSAASSASPAVSDEGQPSLWAAYSGLENLVGVVFLRADKSLAAQRGREQLEKLQASFAFHPAAAARGLPMLNAQARSAAVAAQQQQQQQQRNKSAALSAPPDSAPHRLSPDRHPLPPHRYPTDTLLFEEDMTSQLQESFEVLLHLSLRLKSCVLASMHHMLELLRQEELEPLQHSFDIVHREMALGVDGTALELRLLDDLQMARQWTKQPELASSSGFGMSKEEERSAASASTRGSQVRVPLVKQLYSEVDRCIAERFDAMFDAEEEEAQAAAALAALQTIVLDADKLSAAEWEATHNRTSSSSSVASTTTRAASTSTSSVTTHSRGVSLSHNASGSVHPPAASSKDIAARRSVQPLLDNLKRLVKELSAIKHKLAPLIARNRREVKARRREREERWAEQAPRKRSGASHRPTPADLAAQEETLDLVSFCFERYHQRVIGCIAGSVRFRPSALSLRDLLSVCSFLGWYARFIRHILRGERVHAEHGFTSTLARVQDYHAELDSYADALMNEWVARQIEKANPWLYNIHTRDAENVPEQCNDLAGLEEPTKATAAAALARQAQPRLYFATNAPQDLFTRMNSYADLALDDQELEGRCLYRVGHMLCSMMTHYFSKLLTPFMQRIQQAAVRFSPLQLQCSYAPWTKGHKDKEEEGSVGAGKKGGHSKNASSVEFGDSSLLPTFQFTSLSAHRVRKLADALPIRRGCEPLREEHKKTVAGKDSKSHSTSDGGLTDLKPFLAHLLGQLNNLCLYRFHLEKMSDRLLGELEAQAEDAMEEEEGEATVMSTDAEGEEKKVESAAVDDVPSYALQLEGDLDAVSEDLLDASLAGLDALSGLLLDRVVCHLTAWFSESSIKQRMADEKRREKERENAAKKGLKTLDNDADSASPPLVYLICKSAAEFLSYCLPHLYESLHRSMLLRYCLHGIIVHYLAFLITQPKNSSSVLTPQRRHAFLVQQLQADRMLLRAFFSGARAEIIPLSSVASIAASSASVASRSGSPARSRSRSPPSFPVPDNSDGHDAEGSFSLPSLSNHALRGVLSTKELDSSFALWTIVEEFLTASVINRAASQLGRSPRFRLLISVIVSCVVVVFALLCAGMILSSNCSSSLCCNGEGQHRAMLATVGARHRSACGVSFACCAAVCLLFSFPFHSPSFPTHGLHCVLVLQGCLSLRPDVDPKRRAEIVSHFISFVQQQQQRAASNGQASAAQAPPHRTTSVGRKGSRRNDSDCVIS